MVTFSLQVSYSRKACPHPNSFTALECSKPSKGGFCLFKPSPPYLKSYCKICTPNVFQRVPLLSLHPCWDLSTESSSGVLPAFLTFKLLPSDSPQEDEGQVERSWAVTLKGWTPSPSL